jgi:hypothetical protein
VIRVQRSVRLGMRHSRTVLRLTALRIAFPWAFWLHCYLRLALVSQIVGLILEIYYSSIFGYGTCARDHSTAYIRIDQHFERSSLSDFWWLDGHRSYLAAVGISKRVGSCCIQRVNRAYQTGWSKSIANEHVGQRIRSRWHTGVAIIMG